MGQEAPLSASGQEPVEGAIAAVYKNGEFVESRCTDAQGVAQIPIHPALPGVLRVTAYTEFGSEGIGTDSVLVTAPADVPGRPAEFGIPRIENVGPNPFAHRTVITYSLPRDQFVRLTIFDASGRRVATLAEGPTSRGRHVASWDGRHVGAEPCAAGVYFARLEAVGRAEVRRIALIP